MQPFGLFFNAIMQHRRRNERCKKRKYIKLKYFTYFLLYAIMNLSKNFQINPGGI